MLLTVKGLVFYCVPVRGKKTFLKDNYGLILFMSLSLCAPFPKHHPDDLNFLKSVVNPFIYLEILPEIQINPHNEQRKKNSINIHMRCYFYKVFLPVLYYLIITKTECSTYFIRI